ncbi:MAG: hypothetical protein Q9187_007521, partial [Circinaria calcarea]
TPAGQYSTAQDSQLWEGNDMPPSMLYDGKPLSKSSRTSEQVSHMNLHDHKATVSLRQKSNGKPVHSSSNSKNSPRRLSLTRKRKAESSLVEPPTNRPRIDLKDEVFVRRTMVLPTKADYPYLPANILGNPKANLHDAFQGQAQLSSTFSSISKFHSKCTLSCIVPSQEALVKAAEKAAYLYLISKLHTSGILKEVFGKQPTESLDKQTLQDERDAKLDIYNYAARYDYVPKFTVQSMPRLFRARGRKLVEVTVELSEQNIKVKGKGPNLKSAEIAAALRFKEEAEKYHAEQGSDAIVVRDSTALNTSNVRNFMEYYRIVNPGVRLEVEVTDKKEYKVFGDVPKLAKVMMNGEPVGEAVDMISRKNAEDLAYLTAALSLKKENPQLFVDFSQALRSANGDILRPVAPIDMPVDEDCLHLMRETLSGVRKAGLPDEQDELKSDEEATEVRRARFRHQLSLPEAAKRNQRLEMALGEYYRRSELEELRKTREELPMNQYRAQVIDIVSNNTYSIIIGATGSGKTTQVPQILLEEAIKNGSGASTNIICTQPRRIAATSVAKRVAVERAEQLQDTVGYHVRFDAKLPKIGGSMIYCTTGILLQQLQHAPEEVLSTTTHLIIDEVHERDMLIDFLLIILKKVMAQRMAQGKPVPKVVLMSATMDAELFASYFRSSSLDTNCPTLSVPGRTFPVKEVHLETLLETLDNTYKSSQLGSMYSDPATRDYFEVEKKFHKANPLSTGTASHKTSQEDESIINWKEERKFLADGERAISDDREDSLVPFGLVATTIAHIAKTTKEGAILVFLPGLDEMSKVDDLLRRASIFGIDFLDESKYKLYMLHSSIPAGQTDVFNPVAKGCRKIILATNIAETSITIPDVQHVVDSGKLREKQYDQVRRITKLQCTWISKSNSKQRAGRAGRVQNGHYYALFSKARYESMRAIGLPEILRVDLQETCLDIKAQAFKSPIREFLAEAIEPPAPKAVDTSVMNLQALDALTDEEKITPLGRLLASLPVHPSLGKMIVLGIIFRCLDPMLLLGAAAEERSIFYNPLARRREAQARHMSFVQGSSSDHIAFLNVVREMRKLRETRSQSAMYEFANSNFTHVGAFRAIDATAKQIEEILVEARLIPFTPAHARNDFEYGHPSLNENSKNVPVIKALALAGLHPNLAVSGGGRTFRTPGEKGTIIHPSSVNAARDRNDNSRYSYGSLFSYSTMARSNDGTTIFLRDTSESTPLMATLFGGRLQTSPSNPMRILEMDRWLPFYVKSEDRRAVKTIVEFRKALERLLTGAFRDLSSKRFLAEDPVREMFAEGLVEVLRRDMGIGGGAARKA